ncbi:hypothetical protein ACF0H5_022938 [Mactra antiquata]
MNWNTVFFVLIAVAYYMSLPKLMPSVVTTGKLNDSYDYIIVGAGSAGSVIASRLSEDADVSVLLLEAGGDYTENENFHIPLMALRLQKSESDWIYYTVPQKESHWGMVDNKSYWPRGKVLGGSSIYNTMQYTRGNRYDYDEWAELGCEGWSYKDILPYFLKSEDMLIESLKSSKYHNTGGYLAVSSVGVTPIADVYLQAGMEMGYDIVDYNGEIQTGWSPMQATTRNGIRSSTSVEFLGRINGRSNLHISVRSMATKINIENKIAKGVYFIKDGRKMYIEARKEVIVSGGTINSPQLLMLSGIGPKEHLESLGIDVEVDLPVGDNLQDHLLLFSSTNITEDIGITEEKVNSVQNKIKYQLFGTGLYAATGLDGNGFFCTLETDQKKCAPDIQFLMLSLSLEHNMLNLKEDVANEYLNRPGSIGFATVISLVDPKSVGSIRLKSSDPFDYPIIDPKYLTDRRDVDAYIRGLRLWEKYISTPAMRAIGANVKKMKLSFCLHHEFQSDAYWECIVRHLAATVYHPAGTCKMGRSDDKTAVVDPQLRVKGIKNLRVADASIMPNVITGNTNAPVIMIAEKVSDMIRGRDTVQHLRRDDV